MGLGKLLKLSHAAAPGSPHYIQSLCQLGHAVLLGVVLMLITLWATKRVIKNQGSSREPDDLTPTESLQGAINVLFFCFGMTGVMILVADNIARAFAIGAAIALVRFRIKMGNLLSSAFLFSVLVGMACGVNNIPVAYMITGLYCLVTLVVATGMTGKGLAGLKPPKADLTPGQLIRDADGNWTCNFPRYTATVDGITGNLISLCVKGSELIRRVVCRSSGLIQDGAATSVAECQPEHPGSCCLQVSHGDFNLRWHFFPGGIIFECQAVPDSAYEMAIAFTRNLSALSQPYPARSRYLSEAGAGDTGISAVTRGGTSIVFYSPDAQAILQNNAKGFHGITLGGATRVPSAVEIQIGPATASIPIPNLS